MLSFPSAYQILLTQYSLDCCLQATIMVHLTAMLVVYTLFQAISAKLPQVSGAGLLLLSRAVLQTAYVKLMDVWLLFGLILPFVAFILTVLEEVFKQREEDNREQLSNTDNKTQVKTLFQCS